jgi:RNA polymerase sigma factor (TIGR02999 family)
LSEENVTQMLLAFCKGDRSAMDRLLPVIYNELHRLASRYMRGQRADHTLNTTALIHEAYLKLVDQKMVQWQNRAHFFGVAGQAMRHILVDYAREKHAQKRGGHQQKVAIDEVALVSEDRTEDWLSIDTALKKLEEIDPRQGKIVELRYFTGLTIDETAAVLEISPATVKREWNMAKAWLARELKG